ncbi:unnamed protein product [Arctia plantaginis]|uniref:Cytochrome P450 n=1 Tax=Arctia plantaginis TaxID=874455 RepID=A0A8S0YNR8_ARCPL|nr:unnamed protein product [Arctia plantaginis]
MKTSILIMHQIKRIPIHKKIFNKAFASNFVECSLTLDDIPYRRTFPVIGTKLEFIASGSGTKLHEYIDHRHKQLGPVFREKLGGDADLVFVSDPLLIRTLLLNLEGKYPAHILPEPWVLYENLYGSKRGLFFMNGEEWLENRRIMNKHLLKEGSETLLEGPVKTTVRKFIQKMKYATESGTFVPNLESEFYRLSIDVIVAVILGNNSTIKPNKDCEALLTNFSESVKKIFQTTTTLYGLPLHLCQKFNLKVWRDFKESVDISLSLAHKIVDEVLSNRHHSNGLVKMLSDEKVSDENIKKIIGDFVIAAADTTAYTSLWTLFLLSNQENTKAEIRSRDKNYVNYILKESMRLYPVAPFLTRILPTESVLGSYKLIAGMLNISIEMFCRKHISSVHTIRKYSAICGNYYKDVNNVTPIIASIYTSGRDENNFSEAEKFLPYRWDRNDPRKKKLQNHTSFASLPFALGARSCIGKKLAILQITELISQIVDNFEFKCLNKTEIKANTSQVLVPSTDIKLEFSRFESASKDRSI